MRGESAGDACAEYAGEGSLGLEEVEGRGGMSKVDLEGVRGPRGVKLGRVRRELTREILSVESMSAVPHCGSWLSSAEGWKGGYDMF